jgi:hypothetical protein
VRDAGIVPPAEEPSTLDALLTCSICHVVPAPPWQMCANGHILCAADVARLGGNAVCPQCRVAMDRDVLCQVPARFVAALADALGVADALVVPCGAEGCDARVTPTTLAAHRSVCEYTSHRCFLPNHPCAWTGTGAALVPHLVAAHAFVLHAAAESWRIMANTPFIKWLLPVYPCGCVIAYQSHGMSIGFFATSSTCPPLELTIDTPSAQRVLTLKLDTLPHWCDSSVMGMVDCPVVPRAESTLRITVLRPANKRVHDAVDEDAAPDAKRARIEEADAPVNAAVT